MELMVAVKEEGTTEKCSSKEEFPPAEEGTTKKSFRPSRRRVAHPRAIDLNPAEWSYFTVQAKFFVCIASQISPFNSVLFFLVDLSTLSFSAMALK